MKTLLANRSVVLYNGDALIAKLLALEPKVFTRCITSASKKAMAPVVAYARAHAPVESGALQKSIGVRVKVYRRNGAVVTIVGPRWGFGGVYKGRPRDPFYYAHLQENGHKIVRGGSLKVRWSNGHGFVRAKGTGSTMGRVPGMPFMRPALETNVQSVTSTLRSEIGRFIAKEAKKKSSGGLSGLLGGGGGSSGRNGRFVSGGGRS